MASTGAILITTATDNADGCNTWANPNNALSNTDSEASAVSQIYPDGSCDCVHNLTNYFDGTNIGSTVPAGATIDGIQVVVRAKSNEAYGIRGYFYSVRLIKGGTISGSDLAAGYLTTSQASYTFGGATQKWGLTWNSTDVNASNFGVAVQFSDGCCDCEPVINQILYIDWITIEVFYTASSTAIKDMIGGGYLLFPR